MTLEEERRALEEQRRQLEIERQAFTRRVEIEDRRLEQQQQLFDMKFKMLEEELTKLASEKQHLERQREFYHRVKEFEQAYHRTQEPAQHNVVKGELFFSGVGNRTSLKKRYKDLIKIYHPDNLDGDENTIQEINREYDQLSKVLV
jgi:DNA repair exonuclease SbcCD ATPase subunit